VSSEGEIRLPRIGPDVTGRLKIWPGDLDQIVQGRKRSEVRRCDDRRFIVGQIWELAPWDPEKNDWLTLPSILIRLTHIERCAGPLLLFGSSRRNWQTIPLVVLSFEIV